MKFAVLAAIFGGEFIGVFLEIFLANKFRASGSFPHIFKNLLLLIPLFIISFFLLLLGYIYGFRAYQRIWVITIVSWSSIVLVEPVLNYFLFHELPSGNTLLAAILALAAIVVSILG